MNIVRLLFWSAVAYSVLLVLVRGFFPTELTPTIFLTGIPLIVIVAIMGGDLARKATSPTNRPTVAKSPSYLGNPVQFLSGQLRVAASASNSYFENIVRARLKELLTAKVALEAGLEIDMARRLLSDPHQGARLLGNENLYRILYGPTPEKGIARLSMIGEAVELIGAWTG